MNKSFFVNVAILCIVVALIATGMGGWSDMLGRSFYISKQHAWNDGIFMVLLAIFFLLLARV